MTDRPVNPRDREAKALYRRSVRAQGKPWKAMTWEELDESTRAIYRRRAAAIPPKDHPARSDERNGCFLDAEGCCKVCDGEIPDGHRVVCDIYKLERELATAQEALRVSEQRVRERGPVIDRLRAALTGLLNFRDHKERWDSLSDSVVKTALDHAFQQARDALADVPRSLGPPDAICPRCGEYIANPFDDPSRSKT